MKVLSYEAEVGFLKKRREEECFPVINRGKMWYDQLTEEQYLELRQWYFDWLNVTETRIIPTRPAWLNQKLEQEEIIW